MRPINAALVGGCCRRYTPQPRRQPLDRPESGLRAPFTLSVRIGVSLCAFRNRPRHRQSRRRRGCRHRLLRRIRNIPAAFRRRAMSRPSDSVEASRRGVRTVGSLTNLGISRHEPCSRCREQGCLRPPSIKRVGRSSTGSGDGSKSRQHPSDGSKSIPAIARDKARFHGGELKISKRWKSFKTGALGRGPERRTPRRWIRWGPVPVALAPELNYAPPRYTGALGCTTVYGFWMTIWRQKGWWEGCDAMVSSDQRTWWVTVERPDQIRPERAKFPE